MELIANTTPVKRKKINKVKASRPLMAIRASHNTSKKMKLFSSATIFLKLFVGFFLLSKTGSNR